MITDSRSHRSQENWAVAHLTRLARPGTLTLSRETVVIAVLILLGLLTHGVNLFNYPGAQLDEGTYISQAWSLLSQGRLSPYTYWYDHAPVGWILIAGWMAITGGIHTFGSAIYSGRILMLLLHLVNVCQLFRLTRRLGHDVKTASFAVALFSLPTGHCVPTSGGA